MNKIRIEWSPADNNFIVIINREDGTNDGLVLTTDDVRKLRDLLNKALAPLEV
jgi:hypothetical protein